MNDDYPILVEPWWQKICCFLAFLPETNARPIDSMTPSCHCNVELKSTPLVVMVEPSSYWLATYWRQFHHGTKILFGDSYVVPSSIIPHVSRLLHPLKKDSKHRSTTWFHKIEEPSYQMFLVWFKIKQPNHKITLSTRRHISTSWDELPPFFSGYGPTAALGASAGHCGAAIRWLTRCAARAEKGLDLRNILAKWEKSGWFWTI